MTPEQFAKLADTKYGARLEDGTPIVSLMRDPSGSGGADSSGEFFVSVVERGANGRRWAAVKADPVKPEEKRSAAARAWGKFVGFLKAEGEAAKGDDPTTFEAAMYPREVMNAVWRGNDALCTAIRGIMEDETITDKPAAIRKALDGFSAYVLAEAQKAPALKSSDLAAIREATPAITDRGDADPLAAKAGRVLSAANAGRIRATADKLKAEVDALFGLLSDAGVEDPAEKAATTPEDPVTPAQLLVAAAAAAKSMNPKLTDEAALAIAVKAIGGEAVASKAAAGEPDNDLARLLTESGLLAGGAPMLPDAIAAAIMKVPAMKWMAEKLAALELAVNGTPAVPAAKSADGKDVPAKPGARDVAAKALALAVELAEHLNLDAPVASASGADPDRDRDNAAKSQDDDEDDDWTGTALDLGTRRRA